MPKQQSEKEHKTQWASVRHIRDIFGLSRSSIYKLINEGIVKARHIHVPTRIDGQRLINVASVERFIEASDAFAPGKLKRKMARFGKASGVAKRAAKLQRRRKGAKR